LWLLLALGGSLGGGAARAQATVAAADAAAGVDHVGVWKCVVYGHAALVDERILLRFQPDGATDFARPTGGSSRPWAPLSRWAVSPERVLSFRDPRQGREFLADLNRATLGGTWQSRSLLGGWWCVEVESVVTDVEVIELEHSADSDLMPPLLPEVMATPSYPLAAIRRGLEGQSVVCFFVSAAGQVVAPEIVELTDDVFREPTLEALVQSKFRRWGPGEETLRPACRSYVFRLDSVDPSG
jgi:hypothetical protein